MAKTNDGIVMLLDKVEIGSTTLGYISEEGIDWGGSDAEYTEIFAAQKRGTAVKKIEKKGASNELSFKLIQLDPANCKAVMGGTATATDYTPPENPVTLEDSLKITTGTGHSLEVAKAAISAKFRGKIAGNEALAIEVKCTLLAPPKLKFTAV